MDKKLNLEKITLRLEQLGLNQSELARRVGVSRESVSKWLKDEKLPRPAKLLKLGVVLDLALHELTIPLKQSSEPVVAFRKKAHYRTQEKHVQRAQSMGQLLTQLSPYLPFNKFESPPMLREPSTTYVYIQGVTAEVRRELHLSPTENIRFEDFIGKFRSLQAVLIPVLWGDKEHHENALHIFLPTSMSTWVYLNLDSHVHDFKFWMAHELGHVYIRDEQGEEAENFADLFAQTLLFPQGCAHAAYRQMTRLPNIGARINQIKRLAAEHKISPLTVYSAINTYAQAFSLKPLSLSTIHAATTNFNKEHPTVIEHLGGEVEITPETYLDIAHKYFQTPFFDMLKAYLGDHEKSAGFVQAVLNIPSLDARSLYEELR